MRSPTSEITITDGVLQYRRPGTRWLSSGWRGGYRTDPAAYNVSVPEEWEHVDLDAYGKRRRERAGFDALGPTLFTGVELQHARGARCGPVEAVTTAGVSNPATLPIDTQRTTSSAPTETSTEFHPGTVNIILITSEALTDGALTTLLGAVVEAKTATLLAEADITGTTTDAVVVGCEEPSPSSSRTQSDDNRTSPGDGRRDGDKRPFAGSATTVGAAARACVRESVRASLSARYAETPPPEETEHGVTTTQRATVFDL